MAYCPGPSSNAFFMSIPLARNDAICASGTFVLTALPVVVAALSSSRSDRLIICSKHKAIGKVAVCAGERGPLKLETQPERRPRCLLCGFLLVSPVEHTLWSVVV